MDFVIEHLPPQAMVYMRRIGEYGDENYELMSRLKEWADQQGLFKDSVIYGIVQDNPLDVPKEQCRYDVCLVASHDYPVDESVQRGEIVGGKYAVFMIHHTAEAVSEFWGKLMSILTEQDLRYDTKKPVLERYKYRLVEDGKCEFCVPIL